MFTPEITASSASDPCEIIDIALSNAFAPFALDIAIGLPEKAMGFDRAGDIPFWVKAAAPASAAVLRNLRRSTASMRLSEKVGLHANLERSRLKSKKARPRRMVESIPLYKG